MSQQVVLLNADGDELTVTCTISEAPEGSVRTTEHPVAEGANPTDHSTIEPDRIQLDGLFADEHTEGATAWDEAMAAEAHDWIWALLRARKLVKIRTPRRTYESMMLVKLTTPRDSKTGNAVRFSAVFKQLRIVATQTIQVDQYDPKAKRLGGKKKEQGTKTPRPATDQEAAQAKDQSALAAGDDLQRSLRGVAPFTP